MRWLFVLFLTTLPSFIAAQTDDIVKEALENFAREFSASSAPAVSEDVEPLPELATEEGCRSRLAFWITISENSGIYAENGAADKNRIDEIRRSEFADVVSAFEQYDASVKRVADALFDFCATYR